MAQEFNNDWHQAECNNSKRDEFNVVSNKINAPKKVTSQG
jgi:hypothetical protein